MVSSGFLSSGWKCCHGRGRRGEVRRGNAPIRRPIAYLYSKDVHPASSFAVRNHRRICERVTCVLTCRFVFSLVRASICPLSPRSSLARRRRRAQLSTARFKRMPSPRDARPLLYTLPAVTLHVYGPSAPNVAGWSSKCAHSDACVERRMGAYARTALPDASEMFPAAACMRAPGSGPTQPLGFRSTLACLRALQGSDPTGFLVSLEWRESLRYERAYISTMALSRQMCLELLNRSSYVSSCLFHLRDGY